MFFHGTAYSPKDDQWPGWKFYASVDMSPTNSIWRDAPYFMKYIERCQTYLQWGKPDNDFLVYLPVKDMWKEDTKNLLMQFDIHSMAKKAPDFIKTILAIDKAGFDCDYISDKYLEGCSITADGKIRSAAGQEYKGVIIPEGTTIDSSLQATLEKLGDNYIIKGVDESKMKQLANPEEMKNKYGLKMIRRKNDRGYHYFIANLTPKDINGETHIAALPHEFTRSTKEPQMVWFNPMDSTFEKAQMKGNELTINLKSGESRILLVNEKQPFDINVNTADSEDSHNMLAKLKPEEKSINLTNCKWQLSFTEEAPKVSKTFELNQLSTWENLSEETKVTMGTGVYETTLKLNKKQTSCNWKLDLGDVRESARVYINGKFIGCAWAVPFQMNCGQAFQKGKNTIRIEVTNLPANRISDLDRKDVKWRKMKEINVVDINYKKTSYKDWKPVPSGLNSEVKLIAE